MSASWTDDLVGELHEALLSAFHGDGRLEQMVQFQLEVNLRAIVRPSSLADEALALIQWAKERNKLDALLDRACNENPGNSALRALRAKR